jgi:acyl carrier protein
MGLDSVEILVNVENAFGITISNYEAEKIATVGDIHQLVWRTLQGRQSMRCKMQQLFYKLRYTLAVKFNVPKETIELDASLNEIFPPVNRRLLYRKLEKEMEVQLPPLVLPPVWGNFLKITGALLIMGTLVVALVMVNRFNYTRWLYILPVLGILLTSFISSILDSVRTVIRPAILSDFTRKVLMLNYSTLIQESGTNRKEVEEVIDHIIADIAGVDIQEVTPEKLLADDLGID